MSNFTDLEVEIVSCVKCPRLRTYCEAVAQGKRRQFLDWEYWGKPLPGFGDPKAKLLIVGLAPAAHGGLRTGRMFCGDSSGHWLARALFESGFSNQPTSTSRDDGLRLREVYVTAVVRCAPPNNRPTGAEIRNCLPYLRRELDLFREVKVVLTLGRIAFNGYLEAANEGSKRLQRVVFAHGSAYDLGPRKPILLVSYHPSRQNTQTGRLKWDQWMAVFNEARELIADAG